MSMKVKKWKVPNFNLTKMLIDLSINFLLLTTRITNMLKVPAYNGAISRWLAWYPPAHIPNNPRLRVIMTTPRVWLQPTNPSTTRNTPADIKPKNKIQLLRMVDSRFPRGAPNRKRANLLFGNFLPKNLMAMKGGARKACVQRIPLKPPMGTLYFLSYSDKFKINYFYLDIKSLWFINFVSVDSRKGSKHI